MNNNNQQPTNLQDSGARTHFDTGAIRETGGKGRCDLLPLEMVAYIMRERYPDDVLMAVGTYVYDGNWDLLQSAIRTASQKMFGGLANAMLEASFQFEDGARKYSDRNWEKGIPQHCYIDSAVRHYLKWLRGDQDEPHDRAVMFNLLAAMWNHFHHPELLDLPFAEKQEKKECDCGGARACHKESRNACVCCGGTTDQPGILCDACRELD